MSSRYALLYVDKALITVHLKASFHNSFVPSSVSKRGKEPSFRSMELDGVGKRCSLSDCRRLDYLPVRCGGCGRDFCDEHQYPFAHSCATQPTAESLAFCPQCGRDVGRGTDALSRHLRVDCAARRKRADPRCSFLSCGKRDALAVACPSCSQMFCIEHRHQEVHNCASSTKWAAPRVKLFTLADFANDVSAAVGDKRVPVDERLHVAVHFAVENPPKPRHMFFSWRHSAGKVVDDIMAEVDGLKRPKAPNRFYLYAVRADGKGVNLLPTITPLRDLPAGTIDAGDSLVLHDSPNGLPEKLAKLARSRSPSTPSTRRMRIPVVSSRIRRQNDSRCAMV